MADLTPSSSTNNDKQEGVADDQNGSADEDSEEVRLLVVLDGCNRKMY